MMEPELQPQKENNSMALASLILGIVGIAIILISFCFLPLLAGFLGFILGIVALILALVAKKQIREQGGAPSQNKMATAGLILGIVDIVFGLIGLGVAIIATMMLAGPAAENLFQNILNNLNY